MITKDNCVVGDVLFFVRLDKWGTYKGQKISRHTVISIDKSGIILDIPLYHGFEPRFSFNSRVANNLMFKSFEEAEAAYYIMDILE